METVNEMCSEKGCRFNNKSCMICHSHANIETSCRFGYDKDGKQLSGDFYCCSEHSADIMPILRKLWR
ncbi:MAG: hypothetical protein Q7R52_02680 [archaeon]|nr:hypothetical protein [archaeon]